MKKISIQTSPNEWETFEIGKPHLQVDYGNVETIFVVDNRKVHIGFKDGEQIYEGFPHITTYFKEANIN